MNKLSLLPFLFCTLFSLSCSSQLSEKDKKLAEVEKFVGYLKSNKPDEIYKMTYHLESVDVITDKESREIFVAQISKIIKENRLPPKDKWVYTYNPNELMSPYTVRIPVLFDSIYNRLCHELLIKFPPADLSEKIHDYSLEINLDCIDFPEPIHRNKDSIKVNNNNR